VYERFAAASGLGQALRSTFSNSYTEGFTTVESVCPVGATVTAVGKAVLLPGGTGNDVELVPPDDGSPFYITFEGSPIRNCIHVAAFLL
jgi:hypothetical protein